MDYGKFSHGIIEKNYITGFSECVSIILNIVNIKVIKLTKLRQGKNTHEIYFK